jgi:hypothetical protein
MREITEVLMERDEMTAEEAEEVVNYTSDEIAEALENGAGYGDIEDIMLGLGLEMDYIFDLI